MPTTVEVSEKIYPGTAQLQDECEDRPRFVISKKIPDYIL
jgi:hypothetical protein